MTKKVAVLLATNFEEIEALTQVDVLRRAGVAVTTLATTNSLQVTGAHQVTVTADALLADTDLSAFDGVVFPGGGLNLNDYNPAMATAKEFLANGKLVAAICAAPTKLATEQMLQGVPATCYPAMRSFLDDNQAQYQDQYVVVHNNLITGQGPAASLPFALALVEHLVGKETAQALAQGLLVNRG